MGWLFHFVIFISMRCYVYLHRRLDTGEIFYVGRGTTNKKASGMCDTNTYSRAFCYHKHNKHWINITNKTDWAVEIIADYLSWGDSVKLEMMTIKKYGRKNLNEGSLVNFTDGGEGSLGLIPSELSIETQRKRMSSISNPMKNEINRKKQSERMKKNNPMKDFNIQNKQSESMKNYYLENPEGHPMKGKLREDLKIRNLTNNPTKNPEVIEKIRNFALSRNMKGGKNPAAKKVMCVESGKKYDSIVECMVDLGVAKTTIFRYLNNGKVVYI